MRRPAKKIFGVVRAVSVGWIVIALGFSALWLRSKFVADYVWWQTRDRIASLRSLDGVLTAGASDGWLARSGGTQPLHPTLQWLRRGARDARFTLRLDGKFEDGAIVEQHFSFMGFEYETGVDRMTYYELGAPPGSRHILWLRVPYWLFAASGLAPAAILAARWRRRAMRGAEHCEHCGYDLRATPLRCPECGFEKSHGGKPAAKPPYGRV
jgi:hypothetical protein